MKEVPSGRTTCTASTWKGTEVYSPNMAHMVLITMWALPVGIRVSSGQGRVSLHGSLDLFRSVAVHSMKMLVVSWEIFEYSPLMIGGTDSTSPLESKITGHTGESCDACTAMVRQGTP